MNDQLRPVTLKKLWQDFLPLSLSDVTMACGDPLINGTLAHLPDARLNLGAVGIAKSLVVFFESPIIMLLHASNALAGAPASRRALWNFTLISCGFLTVFLTLLSLPSVFAPIASKVFGIEGDLLERASSVLALLIFWPAIIGWRRYFQGLLIYSGQAHVIGKAGIVRLIFVLGILGTGYWWGVPGYLLAATALAGGILVESTYVTLKARRLLSNTTQSAELTTGKPATLSGIFRFYWPLANSMLIVWGGRALLIAIIARASDATLALAAWPAAWGLVLLIANATRMVQQVVIQNQGKASDQLLLGFALSVGFVFSSLLFALAVSPFGYNIIGLFVGGDLGLLAKVQPVLLWCTPIPFLVALQNASQGFLIADGRTKAVNTASWLGAGILIISATLGVHSNWPGATAAAFAMLLALCAETVWLAKGLVLILLREKLQGSPNLPEGDGL